MLKQHRETLRRGTELAKVQAQGRNQRANTRLKHALEDDADRTVTIDVPQWNPTTRQYEYGGYKTEASYDGIRRVAQNLSAANPSRISKDFRDKSDKIFTALGGGKGGMFGGKSDIKLRDEANRQAFIDMYKMDKDFKNYADHTMYEKDSRRRDVSPLSYEVDENGNIKK